MVREITLITRLFNSQVWKHSEDRKGPEQDSVLLPPTSPISHTFHHLPIVCASLNLYWTKYIKLFSRSEPSAMLLCYRVSQAYQTDGLISYHITGVWSKAWEHWYS